MGTREVTIRFCDSCNKVIEGRLTTHTCPCCGKDICTACQEKEDAKHKPKERKLKVEPASIVGDAVIESTATTTEAKTATKKRGRKPKVDPNPGEKGEDLFIHEPTGKDGDTDYVVSIGAYTCRSSVSLKDAADKALTHYDGKIPDFLSDSEKKTLQDILKDGL